jgi:pilus assembly protein CpaB
MTRRLTIIVCCALILSVCISYLVYRAVGTRLNAGKSPRPEQIIVATRDLEVGALIHSADLKTAGWMGPLPKGAVLKTDSILDRGVISRIYEGEPVTENRLALQGSGGGMAGIIPPGMRACAIKVNDVVGVAGFVVSGMRVDVLISGQPPNGNANDGPRVRTLLQNIEVLSAGTNFRKDQEGKPEQAQVVNLLVTPPQAEILSLASNETHIQLVLRNPVDTQLSVPPGTMMSDLFGTPHARESAPPRQAPRPAPPVAAPPVVPPPTPIAIVASVPPPYVIEVSNGAQHTQVKFDRVPERQ